MLEDERIKGARTVVKTTAEKVTIEASGKVNF